MDHDSALLLLSELVAGRLLPAQQGEVEAHVAQCAECQANARTMRLVQEEVAARGEALFAPHPAAPELVAYAVASDDLDTAQLASIGYHLQFCSTCRQEVALARDANRSAEVWWRRLPEALSGGLPAPPWPVLTPALAAALVLLLYPSYLGLVQLPQARHARDTAVREVESLQRRDADLRSSLEATRRDLRLTAEWGGGVQLLYLPGTIRGAAEEGLSLTLRRGQPLQPMVINFDLSREGDRALERGIVVRILRVPGGGEVWRLESRAADLWDHASQGISLLVPTAPLVPGTYRLEIQESRGGPRRYSATFRVRTAPASR